MSAAVETQQFYLQYFQYGLTSSRYLAEITRLRLHYDDTKKKINNLKHLLADLEDDTIPGQNESDKDRYITVESLLMINLQYQNVAI